MDATLLYGSIEDVNYLLDNKILNNRQLATVLMNAFKRIEQLENQINKMRSCHETVE